MNESPAKYGNPLLLIEDDKDHARLVEKALKDHGKLLNQFIWLKNGEEALDYIHRRGEFNAENAPLPGLILLDIRMPMKNGFDVLTAVRKHPAYKHIPVVMVTAVSDSDDVKRALDMGANDFIVKPIRFADFLEKVAALGHYWVFVSDAAIEKE